MEYTFEKVASTASLYQVRLHGEFVTYVTKKDPALVDNYLRINGYNSREHFYEDCVKVHVGNLKNTLPSE
jgi:hypothetical protein